MKRILFVLALLPALAFAGKPLFQAWVAVDSVTELTTNSWQIVGAVSDYSALGYQASDIASNDLIFALAEDGYVDAYKVLTATNTGARSTMTLEPAIPLTWATSTPGQGKQIVCRTDVYGNVWLPSYVANQADQYLVQQAATLAGYFKVSVTSTNIYQTYTNVIYQTATSQVSVIVTNVSTATANVTVTNINEITSSTTVTNLITLGAQTNAVTVTVDPATNIINVTMTNILYTVAGPAGSNSLIELVYTNLPVGSSIYTNGVLYLGTNSGSLSATVDPVGTNDSGAVGLFPATVVGATWPKALWANSATGSWYLSDIVPGTANINVMQYTNKVVFGGMLGSTDTLQNQSWTVPSGVTNLLIECWGAGGGGATLSSSGGAGGFASVTYVSAALEALTIRVGKGGQYYAANGQGPISYPGGGRGYSSNGSYSGGGGGYSAVLSGTNFLVVAGSGGGAGGYSTSGGNGGAGGSSTGASGEGTSPGTGGSQILGGTNGGIMLQGGDGLTAGSNTGNGGGGGGYYGGGGGRVSANRAGGGGGSCYIYNSSQGVMIRGNNTGAEDYVAPAGAGGSGQNTGSDGMVIIRFSEGY